MRDCAESCAQVDVVVTLAPALDLRAENQLLHTAHRRHMRLVGTAFPVAPLSRTRTSAGAADAAGVAGVAALVQAGDASVQHRYENDVDEGSLSSGQVGSLRRAADSRPERPDSTLSNDTGVARFRAPTVQPAPLFVSARNSEAVLGEKWSWALRQAAQLNVPIITVGRKRLINAALLVAALQATSTGAAPSSAHDPVDAIRRAIGAKRRSPSC